MGSLAAWSWLIITVCSCHTSSQIEILSNDIHGNAVWKDAPEWRGRSVVPRPPPQAVEAARRREQIPRPRNKLVKHVYVRLPFTGRKRNQNKKSKINRIFFSLPFGVQFPIHYSHQSVTRNRKKSNIANQGRSSLLRSRLMMVPERPVVRSSWEFPQSARPEDPSRTIVRLRRSRDINTQHKNEHVTIKKEKSNVKKAVVFKAADDAISGLTKGDKRSSNKPAKIKPSSEIENILSNVLIVF